jgi:hypothetical protein
MCSARILLDNTFGRDHILGGQSARTESEARVSLELLHLHILPVSSRHVWLCRLCDIYHWQSPLQVNLWALLRVSSALAGYPSKSTGSCDLNDGPCARKRIAYSHAIIG